MSINGLSSNQYIEGVYAVQNCQLGMTKNGKPFLKCLIADKTGRTPGRMWNASEELYATLPTDGFVYIQAQTQPYQGEIQLIIQNIKPHVPTDTELRELVPTTKFSIDEMFSEVLRMLGSIENPVIAAIANEYLSDGQLMDRFCNAPAAQVLHHAYLGGLLEHTLSVMKLAESILPHYPGVNRDVVVFGLFLHDLGKCEELSWEAGFSYTDVGQLIGHIGQGVLMLEKKIEAVEREPEHADDPAAVKVPKAIKHMLHHIILSHHGEPEFGALKIPASAEAILISHIDNLDAKMNMAISETRNEESKPAPGAGNFTEKIWALNTKLYRPDPTTVED
ncbi:3'-5' exoribonuclease YhaM family protein [Poriferisphaera corsica]|uniref:3'-5' exoribonuclease YhaM family protein n=1 Tax=Poriferisphaera corsica TaxID=2528020 RepID=UPI00190B5138|nr:HD domain-containing protein [Poriferisphaera corsica]